MHLVVTGWLSYLPCWQTTDMYFNQRIRSWKRTDTFIIQIRTKRSFYSHCQHLCVSFKNKEGPSFIHFCICIFLIFASPKVLTATLWRRPWLPWHAWRLCVSSTTALWWTSLAGSSTDTWTGANVERAPALVSCPVSQVAGEVVLGVVNSPALVAPLPPRHQRLGRRPVGPQLLQPAVAAVAVAVLLVVVEPEAGVEHLPAVAALGLARGLHKKGGHRSGFCDGPSIVCCIHEMRRRRGANFLFLLVKGGLLLIIIFQFIITRVFKYT